MLQGTEKIVGRPQYIEQLKKWQSQTDLIKIVTGVRRCGKSKLFSLYQFDLVVHKIADDSQIININLEDLMQTQKIGLEYDQENFLTSYDKLLDSFLSLTIAGIYKSNYGGDLIEQVKETKSATNELCKSKPMQ